MLCFPLHIFTHLEVVGRGSDTQLPSGLNLLDMSTKRGEIVKAVK